MSYCTMTQGRIIGLLCVLFFQLTKSEIIDNPEERVFLRAQCKALCFQYFERSDNARINKIMSRLGVQNNLVQQCLESKHDDCRQSCFSACDKPPSQCQSNCSRVGPVISLGCSLGCLLLSDLHLNRPGDCPLPGVSAAVAAAELVRDPLGGLSRFRQPFCHKLCSSDASCAHQLHKCCSSGCNRTCTMPIFSNAVPPLPPRPSLEPVEGSPDKRKLSWDTAHTDYVRANDDALVFILQMRFCTCSHFSEELANPWTTILMTVDPMTTFDLFDPYQKYQFRLAAVSTHGSRGFGEASVPYPPPRPPQPQAPKNVTVTKWRINPDGKVSVKLTWMPPESTEDDLELIKYSVSWALDNGYPGTTGSHALQEPNPSFYQSIQIKDTQIMINGLRPGFSYKIRVVAIYFHEDGNLESLPHNFHLSTQSISPSQHQTDTIYDNHKGVNDNDTNERSPSSSASKEDCRCSGLDRNDERLAIRSPETFHGDLTALVELKSLSHMDSQSYRIEWFPQVCIDSVENAPLLTPRNPGSTATGPASEVLKATVRIRMFRLTKLKFNCVYVVRLTPEAPAPVADHSRLPLSSRRRSNPSQSSSTSLTVADVVVGCFCTRSCRETKTAWGTTPIECPSAEPEPPKPPHSIEVKLVNYDRLDYQVSWRPPQSESNHSSRTSTKTLPNGAAPPAIHPGLSPFHTFTRYRVLWAPRKEEPVDASVYNDEAGFSPIPDLQNSDVRVLDRNQTSLILPRLRPRTFYILRIQTLDSTNYGRERESPPAVLYFYTHGDGLVDSEGSHRPYMDMNMDRGSSNSLHSSPWTLKTPGLLLLLLLSI